MLEGRKRSFFVVLVVGVEILVEKYQMEQKNVRRQNLLQIGHKMLQKEQKMFSN